MAFRLGHKNFGYSTLYADVFAGSLTFQMQSGDVANFPLTKPFKATLWDPNYVSPLASPDVEIVEMTYVSGTTFSVLRGQENTVSNNWNEGTPIYAGLTSGMLDEWEAYMTGEGVCEFARVSIGQVSPLNILLNVFATGTNTAIYSYAPEGGIAGYFSGDVVFGSGDPVSNYQLTVKPFPSTKNGIYVNSTGLAHALYVKLSGESLAGMAIIGETTTDRTVTAGVKGAIIGDGVNGYGMYAESKNATALKCIATGTGQALECCGGATFGSTPSNVTPYNRCVSIDGTGLEGYTLYVKGSATGAAAIFIECPGEGTALSASNDGTRPALYIGNYLHLYPRGSDPSTPNEGSVWYNSTDHKLKCWDGTQVRDCW